MFCGAGSTELPLLTSKPLIDPLGCIDESPPIDGAMKRFPRPQHVRWVGHGLDVSFHSEVSWSGTKR